MGFEFFFNVITLVLLITAFGLKTLLFRRTSRFGTAVSLLAGAITVVWAGVLLSTWIPFFRGDLWRWVLRAILIWTCAKVLWEMQAYYGGWRALGAIAALGFRDIMGDLRGLFRRDRWRR